MVVALQTRKLAPMQFPPLGPRPLVSVIVANYNYARFIPEAVASIQAQTYPHWQLLVCDDGSTDESHEILAELERQDPRMSVFYKENGGQASAWNLAYCQASGDIICLLDPDDLWLPDKLEKVVGAFRKHSAAGLVYHRFQSTTADGRIVGVPFPSELESGWLAEPALQRGGWGPGTITSVLSFRRELAEIVFPVPDAFRRGFGDAYIQAVSQFLVENQSLPDALAHYRIHGANDSGTMRPGVTDLTIMAHARYDTFQHIRVFVADTFGEEIATRLRVEDIASYWEYLSALYVMSGKPWDGVHGYRAPDLLRHLTDTRRRQVWHGLFLLPTPLGKSLFQLWWGKSAWKRYTRPVTSLLKLR